MIEAPKTHTAWNLNAQKFSSIDLANKILNKYLKDNSTSFMQLGQWPVPTKVSSFSNYFVAQVYVNGVWHDVIDTSKPVK